MAPFLFLIIVILLIVHITNQKKRRSDKKKQKRKAKEKPKQSCFVRFLQIVAICWLAFIAIVFITAANEGSTSEDSAASPTATHAATSVLTPPPAQKPTKTPKPTATPTPTPTPMPDYAAMSAEQAVQELATLYASAQIELDYVMEYDGLVNVQAVVTDRNWSAKTAIQNVCEYVLDISEAAFVNPDIDSIVFYFNADLRDAYGNLNRSRVINITISRATAEKINYDWMDGHIYVSTKDFLTITDSYNVHQAFADGVY